MRCTYQLNYKNLSDFFTLMKNLLYIDIADLKLIHLLSTLVAYAT